MKHAVAIIAAVLCHTGLAFAAETLIRADEPDIKFAYALGKQVNVRFSDTLVKGRLPKADYEGLVVSETPDGKICLFGREQGIDPDQPALQGIGRSDAGDICVPRADVTLRVEAQAVDGAPPVPFYSTVKSSCAWVWKTGRGIGLWTEDCKFDTGRWNIAYDEAADTFSLQVNGGDPYAVVRQFREEGGPEALLPGLKAQGLVLDDPECLFVQSTDKNAPDGWTIWDVEPTGKRKTAFEAMPGDEVPEPPCGELGMAVDFAGFFMVHRDFPDRILYVNLGQDGTMFDLGSLTLTK